jgi:hypothetical protein
MPKYCSLYLESANVVEAFNTKDMEIVRRRLPELCGIEQPDRKKDALS